VPAPLLASYRLPVYPTAGVPTEDEWNDAMSWMLEKQLLNSAVSYTSSVTKEYLP